MEGRRNNYLDFVHCHSVATLAVLDIFYKGHIDAFEHEMDTTIAVLNIG